MASDETHLDEIGVQPLPPPAGVPEALPRVVVRRRPAVQHHSVLQLLDKGTPGVGRRRETNNGRAPANAARRKDGLLVSVQSCLLDRGDVVHATGRITAARGPQNRGIVVDVAVLDDEDGD